MHLPELGQRRRELEVTAKTLEARPMRQSLGEEVHIVFERLIGGRRAHIEALPAPTTPTGDVYLHERRTRYAMPFMAAARMRDVLGRMMRGSTSRPSVSALRTSLPEIDTGFSPGWLSIKSTRPADS